MILAPTITITSPGINSVTVTTKTMDGQSGTSNNVASSVYENNVASSINQNNVDSSSQNNAALLHQNNTAPVSHFLFITFVLVYWLQT